MPAVRQYDPLGFLDVPSNSPSKRKIVQIEFESAWTKTASQSTTLIPLPSLSSNPDLVCSYLLHSILLTTLVKISFLPAPVDVTAVLILGASENRLKDSSTTTIPQYIT